jgi:hypothetical protein
MKTIIWLVVLLPFLAVAQDSVLTHQEEVYTRPFVLEGKASLGGYVEGNTNYFSEDGISEGFSMELRRFNMFVYSSIHSKIKFLSEVEFEHGTEEIALETAQLDFVFHPAFNVRMGILLPQIGLVNANHDSPKWDFIERPLSSTEIIPTTLSEVGFGLFGKLYNGDMVYSYDAYLVNGLQEGVILNPSGRTSLAAGKSEEMFEEDNNGTPMFNGKIAIANRRFGEAGLSYYGGVYNRYRVEGMVIEEKRSLHVMAFDYTLQLKKFRLRGEIVYVRLDVPDEIEELYGEKQNGAFAEMQYILFNKRALGFERAELSVNARGEWIDYNNGTFRFDGSDIGDEINGITGGISFRPARGTVIRGNYLYRWVYDNLGNPPSHVAGVQVGVATYF